MRPSHILLTFVSLLPLALVSITPARGDDPLTEFTTAFEWAATPSLTLSKGPGHTYQISLAVDSLPSKHLPGLLAGLGGPEAAKVAVVRMTQRDKSGDIANTAITFEPIDRAKVGAVLKHHTDLLDLQEITMDADVFEGKRADEILDLLRADESTASGKKSLRLHEVVTAIASAQPREDRSHAALSSFPSPSLISSPRPRRELGRVGLR
jgi:hypothetical protein